MESPNVLILDEPTNDLDIDTLKALEDYLDDFIGIVIVVSHDRYFLDRVCRRLFIMQANSLDINVLTGNYSEILEQHGYATLTGLNTLQNTSEKQHHQITPMLYLLHLQSQKLHLNQRRYTTSKVNL